MSQGFGLSEENLTSVTGLLAGGWVSAFRLVMNLRTSGDRLRMELTLSDPEGHHLWNKSFDGRLTNTFDWQDQILDKSVPRILGLVNDILLVRLREKPTDSLSVKELALRSMLRNVSESKEEFRAGLADAAIAINRDSTSQIALECGLFLHHWSSTQGYTDVAQPYDSAREDWIEAAMSISERMPTLDLALAVIGNLKERNPTELRRAAHATLRLTNREMRSTVYCGWCFVWIGDYEDALDCFQRVLSLGRMVSWRLTALGGAAFASIQAGRDEAALDYVERGLVLSEGYHVLYRARASALAHLGRLEEAKQPVDQVLELSPNETVSWAKERSGYADTPGTRRYFEGLLAAGMPE